MRYLRRDRRGFTLIELVVVITILGVLVAIAVPMVGGYVDNAKKKAAKTDAKNIQTAMVLFASKQGDYPAESAIQSYANLRDVLDDYIALPQQEARATFSFGSYTRVGNDFKLWIYGKDRGTIDIYIYEGDIIEIE